MAESLFLSTKPLPFCPGCSHHLVVRHTAKALEQLGLKPLEVVLVTDIGCHGIVDPYFRTHTVHGLHGRSSALGAGIAAARKGGKVVVYLGDGGASIGLQHLIECARMNFPLTVLVLNNMLYGMTGGQPSSLTPCGFRTPLRPEGKLEPHYDLCRIVHSAGAEYVSRVNGTGDFSAALVEAFGIPGFSLVEVVETCTSYGLKFNPGQKTGEIAHNAGLEFGVWRNPGKSVFRLSLNTNRGSLFKESSIAVQWTAKLQNRLGILVGGSAGGRVQQAAEMLARASIASGLYATKKGTYPVTVGTGYSIAELILARQPIRYSGIEVPEVAVIVSPDGLSYSEGLLGEMKGGLLLIDEALNSPSTGAKVVTQPFVKTAGTKNAALLALLYLLKITETVPVAALLNEIKMASREGPEVASRLEKQLGQLEGKSDSNEVAKERD
ncbi:MAG: thiamine pyrophosphate-dependent enzyme [candidate division WOR-3 bacterium]|jgi:pyruvate/2-oxoacid:ferredoxin oxidoreductase beta subunit/Pyruvate/2-oxoacid:ferredoxin oxidoreductase gamma subunit|nr:thiamine pyrophosphate-dependent enzyme [candidate division WOR-3 bacterium]MDH7519170.1 thiamine pyrophosphate-dependent enzyme [bacterium]